MRNTTWRWRMEVSEEDDNMDDVDDVGEEDVSEDDCVDGVGGEEVDPCCHEERAGRGSKRRGVVKAVQWRPPWSMERTGIHREKTSHHRSGLAHERNAERHARMRCHPTDTCPERP